MMEQKFYISKDENGFFITTNRTANIEQLSRIVHMTQPQYVNILLTQYVSNLCGINSKECKDMFVKKYNAFLVAPHGYIYFKDEEQTKKTLEWIESLIMMRKLSGC